MNEIKGYADAGAQTIAYRPPSLSEQMIERKARLEQELEQVNKVIAGLQKNPEAAELFNAISRLGGLLR